MEYKRNGDDAIPLGMGSVYKDAIPLPMDSGKPIPLGTKEDMDMVNTYAVIQQDEAKEEEGQIKDRVWWEKSNKWNAISKQIYVLIKQNPIVWA